LERDGHDSAESSLREGLEETLCVIKLGLFGSLRDFFSTTNAIENLIGTVRDVSHNVKRWRRGDMVKRRAGISLFHASKRFRRIQGFRRMPALVVALRGRNIVAMTWRSRLPSLSMSLPHSVFFNIGRDNPEE
jgi:hypothetical protein